MQRNFFKSSKSSDAKEIWKEEPVVAYENYLKYASPEVRDFIEYNQDILDILSGEVEKPKEKKPLDASRISAIDGEFEPLAPLNGHNPYCAKLTIRNMSNVSLTFHFGEKIFERSVGIDAEHLVAKHLQIAYRNIVPSEFSDKNSRSMAGPMGYNEYIIDGDYYNKKTTAKVDFFINSNFAWTPIKIVLENCKGSCQIKGLSDDEISKRFENKCNEKDLQVTALASSPAKKHHI